jgi:hypothetical protein
MAAFLVRTNLSRGDLRLYLTNENGYQQDAHSVKWTVYAHDNSQVSGKSLPAIKETVGSYYAPFFTDVKNGSYRVEWEIQKESGDPVQRILERFFIVDPSSYQCCPTKICGDGVPAPHENTYLTGSILGRTDLPLYLKNSSGVSSDAFAVFWTVYNAVGCPVVHKTQASHAATGEYYASWRVDVCSGDYTITWEWMQDAVSPLESKSMRFSVIDPCKPYAPIHPIFCDGHCPTYFYPCSRSPVILVSRILTSCDSGPCRPSCHQDFEPMVVSCCGAAHVPQVPIVPQDSCCCPSEIPRAVHLATQVLPPLGSFTNQQPYRIPHGIRHITFYITYTCGAPNGYAVFRLFWGNGVEETQETLVDATFNSISSAEVAQDMSILDLNGPIPTNNNPVNFTLEVGVPGGATTVRLIAAEQGVPGAPGTIGITLTAASSD